MLYSEIAGQFRLRKGLLERFYIVQAEWRVVESKQTTLNGETLSIPRVIACLKYKRDLDYSVKVTYRSGNANTVRNVILSDRRTVVNKSYAYKLPKSSDKYAAYINIANVGRRGTFEVHLGNYNNAKDHKTITLAVRAKFVTPTSNPFRTLFEAGFKDEARKLVQDYAKTLDGCTLSVS